MNGLLITIEEVEIPLNGYLGISCVLAPLTIPNTISVYIAEYLANSLILIRKRKCRYLLNLNSLICFRYNKKATVLEKGLR